MSRAGQAQAAASQPAIPASAQSAISPVYTEFHPRWYRPPVSTYWWLGKSAYVKFILRELSSVAVAWTVALVLVQAKGSGFSGMFGGDSTSVYRTRRGIEKRMFQATIVLSVLFFLVALVNSLKLS